MVIIIMVTLIFTSSLLCGVVVFMLPTDFTHTQAEESGNTDGKEKMKHKSGRKIKKSHSSRKKTKTKVEQKLCKFLRVYTTTTVCMGLYKPR